VSHLRLAPPPKDREPKKVDVGQNAIWQAQAGCLLSVFLLPFGFLGLIPWFYLQQTFVSKPLTWSDVWKLNRYPYRQVFNGWVVVVIIATATWLFWSKVL